MTAVQITAVQPK